MKKLIGLILIVVFTTSCAHNKIRFGQKIKIDKFENVQVVIEPVQEIESNYLKGGDDESLNEISTRMTNTDLVFLEDQNSLKTDINKSQGSITIETKPQESIQFKRTHFNDFEDRKKQTGNKNNEVGWGIVLVVLSLLYLFVVGFISLLVMTWGGVNIYGILLIIALLVGGIVLLTIGIRKIKRGMNEKKIE